MDTNRKKRPSWVKYVCIAAAAIIVIVAVAVLPFFLSGADSDEWIYIRPDMTEEALADSLKTKLGDSYASKIVALSSYRPIVHHIGAYRIAKGMSPFRAWRNMSSRAQTPVKFSFNNLRTVDDFSEYCSKKLCMKKGDMLSLLTDSAECASLGFNRQTIPAMLLSDTYEVYWTIKPKALLTKINDNYKNFWTDVRRSKAKKEGLTPVDVATLASIVDGETANSGEKGMVARLYINRLHKGMKLQSDPTVKFALNDPSIKRILHKHLFVKSPYNTYMLPGLPPGPIRLPEKKTIDAVLNAPQHNYIYMCANADFSGTHVFTASYEEHTANARRYQAELNRRGI